MSDDSFQRFNRTGKAAKPGREKPQPLELTPTAKQVFFRLQDAAPLTLTPQEKLALLDVYRKAYPAFYAREMANAQAKRAGWRQIMRVIGWILAGILMTFIVAVFFRLL